MNKKVMISVFLLVNLFTLLTAISYIPGSGRQLISESANNREYHFRYHNGSDDLHWYGTNKWAVRFNFNEVYPATLSDGFLVSKARIMFPQTGDSVRVELFADGQGQPTGQALSATTVLVNSEVMDISFGTPVQAGIIWLIVSYQTQVFGPWVSASSGGGSRSYYLNTNVTNPYYQNMAIAGYNCELNFGLIGNFLLNDVDLQLMDIDLDGVIGQSERVEPTFSIYNHSSQSISNAYVTYTLSTPNTSFEPIETTIQIPATLPPNSLYSYTPDTQGFVSNMIILPDFDTQLRLRATIHSDFDDTEPVGNNTMTKYKSIFSSEYPIHLVENFLGNEHTQFVTNKQDLAPNNRILPLFYYPMMSDTLSNIGASARFNWYGFNSIPRAVFDGNIHIVSQPPNYLELYQQNSSYILSQKTFISSGECRLSVPDQGEQISAVITLTNGNTHLYTSMTDLNLINGSRLYAGLFKKVLLNHAERYVFDRWIAYRDTINTPTGFGATIQKSYNLTISGISLAELSRNYVVVYWLQHTASKQILYADKTPFGESIGIVDEYIPAAVYRISPNPFGGNGTLNIEIKSDVPIMAAETRVFNIKGQLIHRVQHRDDAKLNPIYTLAKEVFPRSGIYFVKTEYQDLSGKNTSKTSKITVIK